MERRRKAESALVEEETARRLEEEISRRVDAALQEYLLSDAFSQRVSAAKEREHAKMEGSTQ